MHYDVFNGDADGIIALIQLRLAHPKESILVTGVKRDIKLLSKIVDKGDVTSVTTLDISMEKNLPSLTALLEQGVEVFYCDHHRSGEIPQSSKLTTLIDLDAEVCTSLLINNKLNGKHAKWAVAGAFGDNLFTSAEKLAAEIGLSPEDTDFLKQLGTLINYNGYGADLDDLHIPPAELYKMLVEYPCPLQLRDDLSSPFYTLQKGYESDHAKVEKLVAISDSNAARVFELPAEAWARRISGVFGNELANQSPDIAHAVLTLNPGEQDYTVSVRAPLSNRVGADEICSSFPTGGGRKAAAGINKLPTAEKVEFIEVLNNFYQ
ncbi:DHH family phosphoesterase [Vibrio sp. sp1]|uniref:DHH family phosphoesterase n=1 Tax=Vibrio TaxID=662 RepID=UPI0019669E6E|nr:MULTISPECIES: DHH family phosphoesterase [Vibrio]MBO0162902.1 DHH family phosphoesterase [Vibrio alginolyticus]QRZ21182.1 DHH family phosphoesterase [Vibrio sp. sp1]